MQPEHTVVRDIIVPNSEISDYIDIIRRRLQSLENPLLQMKYSPLKLTECKNIVEGHLRVLDMHCRNKFLMYHTTFDHIKTSISKAFRMLPTLH